MIPLVLLVSALTASLPPRDSVEVAPGSAVLPAAPPAPAASLPPASLPPAEPAVSAEPAAWSEPPDAGFPELAPLCVSHQPYGPLLDYVWVLRSAIGNRDEVAQVVERARAMGVRGLLVQVVARGDAFYRSDVLPRAESLADSTFDPLGELLPLARAAGLEVHAWVNCAVVWSSFRPPRDPRHVLNAHPEWVVRVPGGRPMTALSADERRRLNVEGVFLSPAHRGMRSWVARVTQEIASRYPVDGIHLDYIRQPGVSLASDPVMRAGFVWRTGIDPERLDRLAGERRAWADSAWTAWQSAQVTAVVREVRDSLERVRPGLALSAAVLPDTLGARQWHAQAWTEWVREGLVDRVFVMCYAPLPETVHEEMQGYAAQLGTDGRVVPGIAVYNSEPAQAAAKIKAATAIGFPVVALYSYDSLCAQPGYWAALQRRLGPDRGRTQTAARGPDGGTEGSWTRR